MRPILTAVLAATLLNVSPARPQDYDKAWEMMAQMRFIERNCPQYRVDIADPNVGKVYGAMAGSARVTSRIEDAEAAANRDASVKKTMCMMIAQNLKGPAVFVRTR